MPTLSVYNWKGENIGKMTLSGEVFRVKSDPGLLHFVVTAYQSNLRSPLAWTKTRGEVRGGGRKPWRQKGTGRARAGSIRSPLWRGGGVVFGPRKRNFKKKVNQKTGRLALKMALSDKLKEKRVIILNDSISISKTSGFQNLLSKLPIREGTILALFPPNSVLKRASQNLPYLKVISGINLIDLLKYDYFLTTKEMFKTIEKNLSEKRKEKKE